MKKNILVLIIISLFCSFLSVTVSAEETKKPLELTAKSAILIEQTTGQILFEKEKDLALPPASVTKIMTMLLIMEAIDSGKIKYTDKVVCSEEAAKMGGSQVFLEPGEEMTVDELLKAIAVASGNDASVMMAEFISGSHSMFVEQMNLRASQLGMKNTVFKNCTGLDTEGHKTSSYDIALMSRELLKHKDIFKYTTIWMDTLRNGKFGLSNTNKLVHFYKDANGLKTGSTDTALFCVSASALRNNMQLIAVVMGSPTSKDRFSDASKLLDYGFANYAVANAKGDEVLPDVKVLKGVLPFVKPIASGDVNVVVAKGKEKLIEKKTQLATDLVAPVEKGQKIGEIVYTLDKNEVGRTPIRAGEYIKRADFGFFFKKLFKNLYC